MVCGSSLDSAAALSCSCCISASSSSYDVFISAHSFSSSSHSALAAVRLFCTSSESAHALLTCCYNYVFSDSRCFMSTFADSSSAHTVSSLDITPLRQVCVGEVPQVVLCCGHGWSTKVHKSILDRHTHQAFSIRRTHHEDNDVNAT